MTKAEVEAVQEARERYSVDIASNTVAYCVVKAQQQAFLDGVSWAKSQIQPGMVSFINAFIEAYCKKYPDEYNFDDQSIGYDEDYNIIAANGDSMEDVLKWVTMEVIPDLLENKERVE